MPCVFRKPNGLLCGAEVGINRLGNPFTFCISCSNHIYEMNKEKYTKINYTKLTFCNFVGNMADTKLPYRCLATGTINGFCTYHSKLENNVVSPNTELSNTDVAIVKNTPVKNTPIKNITPNKNETPKNITPVKNTPVKNKQVSVDSHNNANQVKQELAKLDESDPEDFGVNDVINKLKENKKPVAQKESNKSKSNADDGDETNIETNSVKDDDFEDAAKAKKAEEKAAKKAAKAELLVKIAEKEARRAAKEAAKKEAEEKKEESSEESSEKSKKEKPKKSKK
jgi:hypothetical protein